MLFRSRDGNLRIARGYVRPEDEPASATDVSGGETEGADWVAGVRCTVNTDDPAMFGSSLGTEYATALGLGASARGCYEAGVQGALCDDTTRADLRRIGEQFDWDAVGENPEERDDG